MGTVGDLISDLKIAMSWQAMHHDYIGPGFGYQGCIDLVGWKELFPDLAFFFMAHAGPGICVYNMRACNGLMWIVQQAYLGATYFGNFQGFVDGYFGDIIAFWVGDGE